MRKIVLHIGAGKCGSSALQEYLSKAVSHRTTAGETLVYGVLQADGQLVTGAGIGERARSSIFQYVTSAGFTTVSDKAFYQNLLRSLKALTCDVLVLSFEGWIYEAEDAGRVLAEFGGFDVEVLAYVRSPAQWINSAWWQWGAWAETSFSDWLEDTLPKTFWASHIVSWSQLNFVSDIVVRLLPENIVQDFCTLYGLEYQAGEEISSNVSLPATMQRFLQAHRELRPTPHVSRIEFSLARHLPGGRSAWVIDQKSLAFIIRQTQAPNRDLTTWLPEDQAAMLDRDQSWWSAGYYNDRVIETPYARSLSIDETDALLLDAVKAVHEAEVKILALKKKIREIKADT